MTIKSKLRMLKSKLTYRLCALAAWFDEETFVAMAHTTVCFMAQKAARSAGARGELAVHITVEAENGSAEVGYGDVNERPSEPVTFDPPEVPDKPTIH